MSLPNKKQSLKVPKQIPCLPPVDLSFAPPIIAQSTNNFAEENNLQWCPDLSGRPLHKEITCAMLVYGKLTTFVRKITYTMLYQPCWDNMA